MSKNLALVVAIVVALISGACVSQKIPPAMAEALARDAARGGGRILASVPGPSMGNHVFLICDRDEEAVLLLIWGTVTEPKINRMERWAERPICGDRAQVWAQYDKLVETNNWRRNAAEEGLRAFRKGLGYQ